MWCIGSEGRDGRECKRDDPAGELSRARTKDVELSSKRFRCLPLMVRKHVHSDKRKVVEKS